MSEEFQSDKVVVVRNLRVGFHKNQVLKGISLDLHENENLVVLGRSGVGKSVLIKCIVGLLKPDSGSVFVFNENIQDLKEDKLNALRVDIGYLFQGSALYDSMTIRENLMFPLDRNNHNLSEQEKNERIQEALESVGILDAIDLMPSELSGGMKKRAGLARTLVLKPKIILYDEPTTGLDPFTAREISQLILDIKKKYNTSAIIVTHDMKSARIVADRIIILQQGEIIAEGTYEQLKKDNEDIVKSFFR